MAIACPQCGSGVSETADKCPICLYSMQAEHEIAPPPTTPAVANGLPGIYLADDQTPQPSGSGEVRVSLTGEVIEVPRPPAPRTGPGSPPETPGKKGSAPAQRPGPSRGKYGIPVEEPEEPKGIGAYIFPALFVIMILGGGGYWFMNNRTNPKDNALLVYKGIVKMDWKTVYPLVAMNEASKTKFPDAAAFESENNKQLETPQGQAAKTALDGITDITVGEPTITGNKADVPTAATMSFNGQNVKLKGTAHMIKEGSVWKLDATSSSSSDSLQMGRELFGTPL